jgi:hypothetical protein
MANCLLASMVSVLVPVLIVRLVVLFNVVGIFVASGYDKKVQTWLVQKDYLNLIEIEQKLLP